MPTSITQAGLRSRIRTVVRQPNPNGFISDTEINRLIHEAAYELYDLLIEARGAHYFSTEYGFNTVVGQRRYQLPDDFYKLAAILVSDTPGTPGGGGGSTVKAPGAIYRELSRLNLEEWGALESLEQGDSSLVLKYHLTGVGNAGTSSHKAQIALYPTPTRVFEVRMLYIPNLDLSNDSILGEPVYEGVNGWYDFIIYSVASVIAGMQEESNDLWIRKVETIKDRIKRLAPNRDRSQVTQVADRWGDHNLRVYNRKW